ncbi:BRCT domain-containing protein, partial [Polyplosphaeria fusca]
MGAALKNTVISATGELGVSYDQIKKWVNANGGQWSPKVMKGVTHLISSKEHYKKKVDSVNTAEEIGARIVSYDWLEDSLQKKRKLAEKKYEWKKLGHDRRIRKGIKRMAPNADTKRFNDGCAMARADMESDNYHIFLDETGFEYNISLLRKNLRHNKFARYNIRLFESNTKPHVYCTFIRYVPLGA